jgi:hypothetical protein
VCGRYEDRDSDVDRFSVLRVSVWIKMEKNSCGTNCVLVSRWLDTGRVFIKTFS